MDEPDGTEEQGQPEAEASAPEAQPEQPAQPSAPAGAQHVAVEIGDDGEGAAMVGLDIDRVALWNPPQDCSVGIVAAHTVGISKVIVSGATPGSTVNVVVLPK